MCAVKRLVKVAVVEQDDDKGLPSPFSCLIKVAVSVTIAPRPDSSNPLAAAGQKMCQFPPIHARSRPRSRSAQGGIRFESRSGIQGGLWFPGPYASRGRCTFRIVSNSRVALDTNEVPIWEWLTHLNPSLEIIQVNDAVDKVTGSPRYRSPAFIADFASWRCLRFLLRHNECTTTAVLVVFILRSRPQPVNLNLVFSLPFGFSTAS